MDGTDRLDGTKRQATGVPTTENLFLGDGRSALDILRSVIQLSPMSMVLVDPRRPDGPIVLANRAFTRLTGYEEPEVLGRNCRLLQSERTDRGSVKLLRDAVASGREAQVEMWNRRKDGTAFWNAMFVGPVRDRSGHLIYWFGSQIDETTRREADEARARTRRMDSLGSMAAGIAHEFNNLMTVALGSLERVRKEPMSPRQAEAVGRTEWAARAAGRLTQQMLTFAGRQSLVAEIVDLNVTVRNMDGLLRQAAGDSRFQVHLDEGELRARVDVGQLELALINLVRNASDASPEGGIIAVATRHAPETACVEIAVSDTGSGMAPEVVSRAIEPFFTTKDHGRGTGLGLSMVAGFCKQSGGDMHIDSASGQGTTIRLIFPHAIPSAPP